MMYGYDNINGELIKNNDEFRVIKRIKNLRSRGWSWRKISVKLNDDVVFVGKFVVALFLLERLLLLRDVFVERFSDISEFVSRPH